MTTVVTHWWEKYLLFRSTDSRCLFVSSSIPFISFHLFIYFIVFLYWLIGFRLFVCLPPVLHSLVEKNPDVILKSLVKTYAKVSSDRPYRLPVIRLIESRRTAQSDHSAFFLSILILCFSFLFFSQTTLNTTIYKHLMVIYYSRLDSRWSRRPRPFNSPLRSASSTVSTSTKWPPKVNTWN